MNTEEPTNYILYIDLLLSEWRDIAVGKMTQLYHLNLLYLQDCICLVMHRGSEHLNKAVELLNRAI